MVEKAEVAMLVCIVCIQNLKSAKIVRIQIYYLTLLQVLLDRYLTVLVL